MDFSFIVYNDLLVSVTDIFALIFIFFVGVRIEYNFLFLSFEDNKSIFSSLILVPIWTGEFMAKNWEGSSKEERIILFNLLSFLSKVDNGLINKQFLIVSWELIGLIFDIVFILSKDDLLSSVFILGLIADIFLINLY